MKKRIARSGAGKRGGYRAIVANRRGGPWFFIKGFAKNAMENVDRETLLYCRAVARELIASSAESLEVMVKRNNLKEAICDAQAQERAH